MHQPKLYKGRYIPLEWDAPPGVKAFISTCAQGDSLGPYAAFNIADHVGDDPLQVKRNRELMRSELGYSDAQWLQQVHGTQVVEAQTAGPCLEADAVMSDQAGLACVVMTADCLPVFFSSTCGRKVAVAHAGWRGLLDGVLEQSIAKLAIEPCDLHAYLGPAISQACFEVGAEVREAFCALSAGAAEAFVPSPANPHKYLADLHRLARQRLEAAGVRSITAPQFCTFKQDELFYSYRRQSQTGRMASVIWFD